MGHQHLESMLVWEGGSWYREEKHIAWLITLHYTLFREGNGTPLQYSCLENAMDGGAWWATVHGVVKSRTWLSDFTFTFHFNALEQETAMHSSVLAWRIPGTEEPGGLPSRGLHRIGHDWSSSRNSSSRPSSSPMKPNYSPTSLWGNFLGDWSSLNMFLFFEI